MKRECRREVSVTRPSHAGIAPVYNANYSAVRFIFALGFYFFGFWHDRKPICEGCAI